MAAESYYDVITAAVNDLAANGFDSVERVAYWQERIRKAAEATMGSTLRTEELVRDAMASVYARLG